MTLEKVHGQEKGFNGEIKAVVAEAQYKLTAEKFHEHGCAGKYLKLRKRLGMEEPGDDEDRGKGM